MSAMLSLKYVTGICGIRWAAREVGLMGAFSVYMTQGDSGWPVPDSRLLLGHMHC